MNNVFSRLGKKLTPAFQWLIDNLHYVGLVMVVSLIVQARVSTEISGKTLDDSVKQQELIRNILWANLMMQRAAVLTLSHPITGDDHLYGRAISVIESIPTFINMKHMSEASEDKQKMILEKTGGLHELLEKMSAHPSLVQALPKTDLHYELLNQVEKMGADLNESESAEWYKLLDQNSHLIEDFKFRQKEVYLIYLVFALYLIFLGWISSRKRKAELQLITAESRLVEASKLSALGEMAAGVAHEVNNPLAIINTLSSQLQELMDDETIDRAEVKRVSNTIENTTQRISRIVNGLRSLSRDGSRDAAHSVQVSTVVAEVMGLCAEKFKNHGIEIRLGEIPNSLVIECRSTQIAQVLLNLMNNAHDAIMNLSERWIEIKVQEGRDSIEFQVTDSGNGIPKEIQKKLFQPFFTTKDIGKGTGLGLSISRGIIQSHGGEFSLDARCPRTRFVIVLPKTQENRNGESAA